MSPNKKSDHRSVGAIIKDKKGRILMLDRKKPPLGWACPAGHVEKDEDLEVAVAREVLEETGLEIGERLLLIREYVPWNKCSKGAKGHDWIVYEVLEWSGTLKPQ